ncbi:MAG: agmatinase [Candidatus Odinarchaeota archaeon]
MASEIPGMFQKGLELPGMRTEFEEAPLVIAGVPLEYRPSFRSGCHLAPPRIRENLYFIECISPFTGHDLLLDTRFHDLGDMILDASTVEKQHAMIEETVSAVLARGKKIGLMGGDHSILLPGFNALKKTTPDAVLVVFDAHLDLRPSYGGAKLSHACVLRRVLEKHPDTPVLHIGSRVTVKEEEDIIESFPGELVILDAIDFNTMETKSLREKVSRFFENYHGKNVHISFDMDCYDPSAAPGVTAPDFPGLTAFQALQALQWVKGEIASFDVSEFTPAWDANGITAVLAAKTFNELMIRSQHPSG